MKLVGEGRAGGLEPLHEDVVTEGLPLPRIARLVVDRVGPAMNSSTAATSSWFQIRSMTTSTKSHGAQSKFRLLTDVSQYQRTGTRTLEPNVAILGPKDRTDGVCCRTFPSPSSGQGRGSRSGAPPSLQLEEDLPSES